METSEIPVIKTDITYIKNSIRDICKKQDEILNKIESQYITRVEFNSVKEDVDGMKLIFSRVAWTIILIVITAVIGLVVKTNGII